MDQQRLMWDTIKIKECFELKSKNKTEENCCMVSRQQGNYRGKWRRVVFDVAKNGKRA